MSTNNGMMKPISTFALLLMMGVSMSACSAEKRWKEEVLLHDGNKIIVERAEQLGGRPTLESRERQTLGLSINFVVPETGRKAIWEMSFRNDVPEPNGVNVIVLDIVNGIPYIGGYPAGCIAYNKWKRPNPPQILFKYEADQWKRISLSEFPLQLTKANIIVGSPPAELLKSFYTVEQVNVENHDISTEEYKTILRQPLPQAQINNMCEELVYYKGAWVGPGDSIGKRMMDRRSK